MNEAEMALVAADLRSLVGAPLVNAWQPRRDRLVLGLGDALLLVVPRGPMARLHTLGRRPHNPKLPFSFQGAVRAWLGGPLTALEKVPGDRALDLVFGPRRLHLRLTGRGGGLWLLEGDRVVAAYDGPAPDALPPLASPHGDGASPRFEPGPGEGWDAAARRWFEDAEARQEREERRASLQRAVRRGLAKLSRLEEALVDDLDRASEAPALRRQADALAASLHRVPRGASRFEVEDLEDPAIVHQVALDPGRPASVALEKLYGRARRLDRVGERVLEQLDDVERKLSALRQALDDVASADDDALERIAALVPPEARREPRDRPAAPWVTWTGPGGRQVLVGRNAKANRRLTFQQARGYDWWMHVRGRPGAHLILPMGRDVTPSLDHLLAAAQLALIASGVPEGTSADVQYTRVRHVRSVPGEEGLVLVHEEKVLHVTRDPAALVGWVRADG